MHSIPDTHAIIKGRVVDLKDVAPHIRIITVQTEHAQPFSFRAGQFAHLTFLGQSERPYSIASPPHQRTLEFHIKSVGHGVSAYITERLKPGEEVMIRGPEGNAFLRDTHGGPILAIAGGLGIAPIKSILETALHRRLTMPIHLYMGGRQAQDLYLEAHFRGLSKLHPNLHIIPVLSEESENSGRYRVGQVGRIAVKDFPLLHEFTVYLAGPPPMISDIMPLLLEKGARESNIHSDALNTNIIYHNAK